MARHTNGACRVPCATPITGCRLRWATNLAICMNTHKRASLQASHLLQLLVGNCELACRAMASYKTIGLAAAFACTLLQLSHSAGTRHLWVDQCRWGDLIPLDGTEIRCCSSADPARRPPPTCAGSVALLCTVLTQVRITRSPAGSQLRSACFTPVNGARS